MDFWELVSIILLINLVIYSTKTFVDELSYNTLSVTIVSLLALVVKIAMKMLQLVLLLGIVAIGQCQDCFSDENPVTACNAEEILEYIQANDLSGCNSVSILTDSGAACSDLIAVLQVSLESLGSGTCLPASVNPDSDIGGAAETGDAEDDAIQEVIDEPHPTPGQQVIEATLPPNPPADHECFTHEDGSDYFGEVSVTQSGIDCQSWGETQPHRPIKKYRGYGNVMHPAHFGPHTHCRTLPFRESRTSREHRNNYSGRTGPWCYTTNPEVRWEYCDVGESQTSC